MFIHHLKCTFRFLFFTLAILVIGTPSAHACTCVRPSEEESQKIVEEAFFIGVVETVNVEVTEKNLTIYTLKPVAAYKGEDRELIKVENKGWSSCDKDFPKKGTRGERIINQRDGKLILASMCTHGLAPEQWEKLRPISAAEIKKCKNNENSKILKNSDWDCIGESGHLAEDAGKSCQSNDECEGSCMIKPTIWQKVEMRFFKRPSLQRN